MAELALHRCVERKYETDDEGGQKPSEIQYSYEFLDDFVTPRPTLNAFLTDVFRWKRDDKHERMIEDAHPAEIGLDDLSPKSPTVQGTQHADDDNAVDEPELESKDDNWKQEKFDQNNHPLELMVSYIANFVYTWINSSHLVYKLSPKYSYEENS